MKKIVLSLVAVLMFLVGPIAAQTPTTGTGSISGTVLGDDGKALVAFVTLNRAGAPATGHATSGSDGKFTLANLAAGTYTVCAVPQAGGYLNPWAWSAALTTVKVAPGQAVTGYNVILKTGAVVQVRLNDSAAVLGALPASNAVAPHVLVGVRTARRLVEPFVLASKDTAGRNLQGTIPLNTPVVLEIVGKGVSITDASGTTINPSGATVTLQQPTGAAPKTVTFNVTSGKP